MSQAFRCDRCLELFEDVAAVVIREENSDYYESSADGGKRTLEFCDKCRSAWILFRRRSAVEDLVAVRD